ncbi:MAG: hypothetical protein ABWY52_00195 [Candidatus Limnocylindrales bacterium]
MIIGRRLAAALDAAVSDAEAWPIGMLGFLVRGGIVVLALPILTLPSPVGLATILGPAVISTGRLDGPLLSLLVLGGIALIAILAVALVLAAIAQQAIHVRWGLGLEGPARVAVRRLSSVELLALAPIAIAVLVTISGLVDDVRSELLLPGDLAVPLVVRVVARAAVPIGALAAAIVVAEAIDGTLARRVLVHDRSSRGPGRSLWSIVATASLGWIVTLVVLAPGLFVISATWQRARAAWSQMARPEASAPDAVLAFVAAAVVVAVWLGLLLLCGVASIVRAHLWTSRVSVAGDWTDVGH